MKFEKPQIFKNVYIWIILNITHVQTGKNCSWIFSASKGLIIREKHKVKKRAQNEVI